jgi:hypothetical protein
MANFWKALIRGHGLPGIILAVAVAVIEAILDDE